MDTVRDTVQHVLAGYAGEMLNGYSYLTANTDATVFVITAIGYIRDQHFVDTSLVVRIRDNTVIIDYDVNDKPLVDALLAAGIPRSQIILAYAGEAVQAAA